MKERESSQQGVALAGGTGVARWRRRRATGRGDAVPTEVMLDFRGTAERRTTKGGDGAVKRRLDGGGTWQRAGWGFMNERGVLGHNQHDWRRREEGGGMGFGRGKEGVGGVAWRRLGGYGGDG